MPTPDRTAAAQAIAAFLRALGHEPVGDLAETPALVAQAWCEELLAGYRIDPAGVLRQGAAPCAAADPGLVVLRDLAVTLVCPHHLLPALGQATVIYQPVTLLAGLGAIARALDGLTRRLSFQETAGVEMAALLVEALGARGALCQLRLRHCCLSARGARQSQAWVESIAWAGSFATPGPDRDAALAALGSCRVTGPGA
jgi:GTP cyclohydrolase I